MRVGIGIILSVLSFSVLATVIPNNDDHGTLLVRRAGSLQNKDVLWSKDNEDQVEFVPSNSEADDGGSSPNLPSDNSGLGNPGKPQRNAKGFGASFKKGLANQKQKYVQWSDKRRIKKAVKKVTEVIEGQRAEQVISEINDFLTTVLNSGRKLLAAYGIKTNGPFSLSISKSKNQSLLTQEMNTLQNTAERYAKAHLKGINAAIIRLTKNPRGMVMELNKILGKLVSAVRFFVRLDNVDYKPLLSRVKNMSNEAHVKVTEAYIHQVKNDHSSASKALWSIKDWLTTGKAKFKDRTSS
ncbi:hypothetical protein BASA50_004773 [Batrachochytrium salamandrivorans]|uniref:Altered inheritance of mitochondria protein 23, mitochondrial n=1 Tax=Batrachochytrium salamandrivorans TaxID=1357716 RepID=A0ABQ8FEP2_9FUNG|nr:hypothetical protein BASA50_004773 [Batrachochytrium salamandrivorans]KAH9273441.1 hypothetical protein BASA83_004106 [Batrachochytrium salamandrivorans]